MRRRENAYRAIRALELAANNGLLLDEVGELCREPLDLARFTIDTVLRAGVGTAVKLEAAALLRDGWMPGEEFEMRRSER